MNGTFDRVKKVESTIQAKLHDIVIIVPFPYLFCVHQFSDSEVHKAQVLVSRAMVSFNHYSSTLTHLKTDNTPRGC